VNVEAAVVAHLASDMAIAALVGTRVYHLKLPQSAKLPAVRVQLIDEQVGYQLRGEDGATPARIQVDAFAAEPAYDVAIAIATAVDDALSGQRFSVGSPAFEVIGVFRLDRRVMYEAEELRLVRVLQDYRVWSRTIH